MGKRRIPRMNKKRTIRIAKRLIEKGWRRERWRGSTDTRKLRTFVSGPRFKSRRIARNSCKVAIVDPIQNTFFLCNTRPSLSIIFTDSVRSSGKSSAFIRRFRVVRLDETTTDEKEIANLDVSALGLWPDVNALIFTALE